MARNKLFILLILMVMVIVPKVTMASSPTGITTISLAPLEKTIGLDESLIAQIKIDTKDSSIKGLRFVLNFSSSVSSPALEIQDISLADDFRAWTLTKTVETFGNVTKITAAATIFAPDGYTNADQEVTIVNIASKGIRFGTATASFDPDQTAMWENLPGGAVVDILQTPATTGTYTVGNPPTTTPILSSSPTSPPPTPIPTDCLVGDLNCDGKVNEVDLTLFLKNQPASLTLTTLLGSWKIN